MTEQIYRTDAYAKAIEAKVVAINEHGGIVLDRTNFYAAAGGQAGDKGVLSFAGRSCPISTTVYDADKATIVHVPAEGAPKPEIGAAVTAELDWATRHAHMRMHSALHLLCSLVKWPVTGGQITAAEGRLDFDIADMAGIDKETLTGKLNALVAADHPIGERWISDAELDANPSLVRTLSVQPPRGSGRIRLVAVGVDGAIDLQPCGGTHVRSTAEIGRLAVAKIENKGKQNRRIRVVFA
ncbi:MAG TPA: alanyl-tRNA editing protein [Hyphomicrobiaceae bacterium]|nr:alanyl-tRNA editing protein [Hyphomicrobiaceae bacterium]